MTKMVKQVGFRFRISSLKRIRFFLPIILIVITFLSSITIGVFGYLSAQANMSKATMAELKLLTSSRQELLNLKLKPVKADLSAIGRVPLSYRSLYSFIHYQSDVIHSMLWRCAN